MTAENYDPFARGPHPVGVRSETWRDAGRGCSLDVEIWYPALDGYAGQDLDEATRDRFVVPGLSGEEGSTATQSAVRDADSLPGRRHAVLLCHGFAGHRRESSFMATHLASHGFLVVSADHPGGTYAEIDALLRSKQREGRHDFSRSDILPALVEGRRRDLPLMIETVTDRFDVDGTRLGITGASFGGWTSLFAPGLDARIRASAPMCPSGGASPVNSRGRNVSRDALDFEWKSSTPVLFMVADRDTWLPLYGEIELFRSTPGPKRMFVLERADHNHFVDNVAAGHEWLRDFTASLAEVEEPGGTNWAAMAEQMVPYEALCSEDEAHTCWRGLCAAHMDAHLRADRDALDFWRGDVHGALARRGIDVVELSSGQGS